MQVIGVAFPVVFFVSFFVTIVAYLARLTILGPHFDHDVYIYQLGMHHLTLTSFSLSTDFMSVLYYYATFVQQMWSIN